MKVRFVAVCSVFVFAAMVWGSSPASAQAPAAEGVIDHYLCHKLKDLKSPAYVKLTGIQIDEVLSPYAGTLDTKKLFIVCMPSLKNGSAGPLINPDALLCGYKVKGNPRKFEPRPTITVTSQFQNHSVELKKPFLLMAPCDELP